jgi:cation diffusion facilitator CzcD-associated flavoprotein CzcO
MTRTTCVAVIGAGQAGLAVSHLASRHTAPIGGTA